MSIKKNKDEEQMMRRQSAPIPTEDEAAGALNAAAKAGNLVGGLDAFAALSQPIGKEAIAKANQTLQKYKQGKANLEKRIVDNEQWYRLRHWDTMAGNKNSEVKPVSAWLFNAVANKHADAMDNYPSPNILPREESDKGEAELLSSIVPVILANTDFERVYDEVWTYKLKSGTGVYGVFWDKGRLNGLGDITIKKVDLLNLFWEPGITDIQQSRNLFHTELVDNDALVQQYPTLKNKLSSSTIKTAEYVYDDSVDTTDKTLVIDWYYKKINKDGKTVLHYVKYVGYTILYATENVPEMTDRGLYDHGRYPFEFDPLFRVEGTPAGFGYIDVGKSAQEYIDRGNQAIMANMLANTKPRYFIRNDGGVNEEEYADMTKDFVHCEGNLGSDSISPINGKPLNSIYVSVINNKIEELKETTGNRDVSTGGTASGVTAASAIAAMQEAGSKLSRDANKAAYRVFRQICLDVIELIRQFYDLPRCFRIVGKNGAMEFISYTNAGLAPQEQGNAIGTDLSIRVPLFDIDISAERSSPYSKMAQNELALQFYSAGFFNPQASLQALACLNMMDFDHKSELIQRISQNSNMLQQMMMLAQMVDNYRGGSEITLAIAQQYGLQAPAARKRIWQFPAENKNLGGNKTSEASNTRKARERVADSTSPR